MYRPSYGGRRDGGGRVHANLTNRNTTELPLNPPLYMYAFVQSVSYPSLCVSEFTVRPVQMRSDDEHSAVVTDALRRTWFRVQLLQHVACKKLHATIAHETTF